LDVHAREALEDALRDYPGTICLVSHDIEFIRHLAGTIYAMTPDGVRKYYGNYDYYREKAVEEAAAQAGIAAATTPAATGVAAGDDRRTQRREEARSRQEFARQRRPCELRIQRAEQASTHLEKEQSILHATLLAARPGTDFAAINRRLTQIETELADALAAWEAASLEIEELRRRCGLE
jgi:ATP-binding cassette subfamily F protein 3